MMPSLVGTAAAYLLLAVLLLSLNIVSLWRWWVKAGAIVVTCAVFVLSYIWISGLLGWASPDPLPAHFNLLSSHIEEPNLVSGSAGKIFMWVEELNDQQLPISEPRNYELPFVASLADKVDDAQKIVNEGNAVMGVKAPKGNGNTLTSQTAHENDAQTSAEGATNILGHKINPNPGAGSIDPYGDLSFAAIPLPDIPDKDELPANGIPRPEM